MDISNHLNGNVSDGKDLEIGLADGTEKSKQTPKPKLISSSDLDKMIADSLKEIGSDNDDDEVDDDDPELLKELKNIIGDEGELEEQISFEKTANEPDDILPEPQCMLTTDTAAIIRLKIEMYKQAQTNATYVGEGARARRLGRGLKTLNDLLKQSLSGKPINVDDIPIDVSVKTIQKSSMEDSTIANSITDNPPKVSSCEAPPSP